MGKRFLVDTNAVIDYLADKLPAETNLLLDKTISKISVITKIELLGWYSITDSNLENVNSFISNSFVIQLDEKVVMQTINVRRERRIKLPDAIIAATAITHNLTLITRNTQDFAGLSGLELLNPYINPQL